MKYTLIYILIPFFIAFKPAGQALASSGLDRCHISKCLCEVIPGPKAPSKSYTEISKRVISVYFEEDNSSLSTQQKESLNKFFSFFTKDRNDISIIGHTDGCGTPEYNKILSAKRAQEVSNIAKKILPMSSIKRVSGGENAKEHLASARRVDIIIHTKRRLTSEIERVPSDFYLIDASGSMWTGYKKWNDIINVSVKPKSRVFLSITNGCYNGWYMEDVSPRGGTEIWWSYWNVIDEMKPGETLLIVSDFQSQVPLSAREAQMIRQKVFEAGIIVRSIAP